MARVAQSATEHSPKQKRRCRYRTVRKGDEISHRYKKRYKTNTGLESAPPSVPQIKDMVPSTKKEMTPSKHSVGLSLYEHVAPCSPKGFVMVRSLFIAMPPSAPPRLWRDLRLAVPQSEDPTATNSDGIFMSATLAMQLCLSRPVPCTRRATHRASPQSQKGCQSKGADCVFLKGINPRD